MMQGMKMVMSGSIWVAKEVPGAAEYLAFQKAAGVERYGGRGGRPASTFPGMDKMIKAMGSVDGMTYLTEMTMNIEGTGQIADMMKQMGAMKIDHADDLGQGRRAQRRPVQGARGLHHREVTRSARFRSAAFRAASRRKCRSSPSPPPRRFAFGFARRPGSGRRPAAAAARAAARPRRRSQNDLHERPQLHYESGGAVPGRQAHMAADAGRAIVGAPHRPHHRRQQRRVFPAGRRDARAPRASTPPTRRNRRRTSCRRTIC